MNQAQEINQKQRGNTLLIVLATIGGLTILGLLSIFALFFFTFNSFKKPVLPNANRIGIIEIKGILDSSEDYLKYLRQFQRDDSIKAVIVRIDCPGGAVGASQELYSELKSLNKSKPVIASLGNLAASGGYYTAIGAREIVSNPGTITGSIGVIMKLPNVGAMLEKLGIKLDVIKSGALKDLGPMTRDLTPEEKAVIESVMHDIHRQFITAVSESRKLPLEQVESIADGRIFSGRQALELKLIDRIGNFNEAVRIASKEAGLTGEPELVYPQKDRFLTFKQLLEEEGANTLSSIVNRFLLQQTTLQPTS
ncbi:MAG: signal peptide peptidase SppA [Dissulfuribacterales bacterium]